MMVYDVIWFEFHSKNKKRVCAVFSKFVKNIIKINKLSKLLGMCVKVIDKQST